MKKLWLGIAVLIVASIAVYGFTSTLNGSESTETTAFAASDDGKASECSIGKGVCPLTAGVEKSACGATSSQVKTAFAETEEKAACCASQTAAAPCCSKSNLTTSTDSDTSETE